MKIWTIGHSTRTLTHFMDMLQSFDISHLIDVRHYPGSRKYPHFNKDVLDASLSQAGIRYTHLETLGGRRKPKEDSTNTSWRHSAFRGYADYMETADFHQGIKALKAIAQKENTAYMCSESVWWRCHRSMISDYLKAKGWEVFHIMEVAKSKEHPYTAPARLEDGQLTYKEVG